MAKQNKTKVVAVRLTDSTHRKLEAIADSEDINFSEAIRRVVEAGTILFSGGTVYSADLPLTTDEEEELGSLIVLNGKVTTLKRGAVNS